MSERHNKICPRCGAMAVLSAVICRGCGRKFRTQFIPESLGPLAVRPAGHTHVGAKGSKQTEKTSLLPAVFNRPSEENPEFAAPEGTPPTYSDLPNIDILRQDLNASLARIGQPVIGPMSELTLADAPGSPLVMNRAVPSVQPDFSSFLAQQTKVSPAIIDQSQLEGIDWNRPGTLLNGFDSQSTTLEDAVSGWTKRRTRTTASDAGSPSEGRGGSVATDHRLALGLVPVTAPAVEIELNEDEYRARERLLNYDPELEPNRKIWTASIVSIILIAGIMSLAGAFDISRLKTSDLVPKGVTDFYGAGQKAADVDLPIGMTITGNGEGELVAKPLGDGDVVVERGVGSLDPSVFSQKGPDPGSPLETSVTPVGGAAKSFLQDKYGDNATMVDPNRKKTYFQHLFAGF